MYLSELREKHHVGDAIVLVDGAPWSQTVCHPHGLRFQHVTDGNRTSVDMSFIKQNNKQISYQIYRNVEPNTAENWLQAFASAWNQFI